MKLVAEISCNHAGDIEYCKEIMADAHHAGADFVKIQCYDESICIEDDKKIRSGPWAGMRLRELYAKAKTPPEWMPELFRFAYVKNIPLFSSVFDLSGLDLLKNYNPPLYKIASIEAFNGPLIKACLKENVPVIISLGKVHNLRRYIADFLRSFGDEIGARDEAITFLACDASYVYDFPSWKYDFSTKLISDVKDILLESDVNIGFGYSDHCPSMSSFCNSWALECEYYEVHVIGKGGVKTLDESFSITIDEIKNLSQIKKTIEARHYSRQYHDNEVNLIKTASGIKRAICPPNHSIILEKSSKKDQS